jgi:TolB-like protein/Tfp pilus assembly protein PilF
MACGRCPFGGNDIVDVLQTIQHRQPTRLEQLRPKLPSRLVTIVDKTLDKDRSLRYQSAAEMRADLRALYDRIEGRARRRKMLPLISLAVLLAMAVLAGSMRFERVQEWILGGAYAPRQMKSIVVLPLENLSGDAAQDYFADGITDALITSLSRIGALRVISRTSSMHYKATHESLPEIARELNVDAVVEGTVAKSGTRVRISARLIDPRSEQHLWTRQYDNELQDILQLQNDLASAIALEVAGRLSSKQGLRPTAKARSVNPQAYEAFLKGEYFLDKWTGEGFEKAKGYFQQSIDLDPAYANGYTGLAEYYAIIAFLNQAPSRDAWLKAEDLLSKSLAIDNTSSRAHTLLGMIKFQFHCDQVAAEKELNYAMQLNPGDMNALDLHSYFLLEIGHFDQAIKEKRRVLDHDPLRVITNAELGLYLLQAKLIDEAMIQLQKTLELDPNYAPAHARLGLAYAEKQQYGQAVLETRKAISLNRSSATLISQLGEIYARWGKKQQALGTIRELQRISKQRYVAPNLRAVIYARLGEKDAALAWLENAKPDDQPKITDPGFDGLRSDPKFNKLEAHLKPDPTCPAF